MCPSSLDREEHVVCRYGVFKVHAGIAVRPNERTPLDGAVSQNSAVQIDLTEVDIVLGELVTGRIHHGRAPTGVKSSGIP